MVVWHYSRGIYLQSILSDGCLKVATAGVYVNERPAVWFTVREDAQSIYPGGGELAPGAMTDNGDATGTIDTSYPIHEWNLEETHENVGITRFGVDETVAAHTWRHHKQHGGINARVAHAMYNDAIRRGDAPTQWRLSYEPVFRKDWRYVQIWDGNQFQDFDSDLAYEMVQRVSGNRAA